MLVPVNDGIVPGGDSLEVFEQFGKPIWMTEFSCHTSATAAEQEAYVRVSIPYLEGNPNVFRYSWFSADPIPNAKLVNSDGSRSSVPRFGAELPVSARRSIRVSNQKLGATLYATVGTSCRDLDELLQVQSLTNKEKPKSVWPL